MMRKLCSLLLVLSGVCAAEQCDFLEAKAQPAWVTTIANSGARFFGSGAVEQDNNKEGLAKLQQRSRQAALQNLAENIETNINSSVTVINSVNSAAGGNTSDIYAKSVSESFAAARLSAVTTEDTWLDRNNCVLWTLLSVSKATVTEAKLIEQSKRLSAFVDQQLSELEGADLSQQLLSASATLSRLQKAFSSINPQHVTETFNYSAVQKRLAAMAQQLQRANVSQQILQQAQTEFNQQLQSYQPGSQRLQNLIAIDSLIEQGLLVARLNDAAGNDVLDTLMQVLELEQLKDNACYVSQRIDLISRQFRQYRRDLRKEKRAYKCSDQDARLVTYERLFLGHEMVLFCDANLQSQTDINKACSDIANQLGELGASVILTQDGRDQANILITAAGTVTSRGEGSARPEYQVSAQVTTLTQLPNGRDVRQSYQGLTGWIPANAQLAADMLSINIVKRWQKELDNALD